MLEFTLGIPQPWTFVAQQSSISTSATCHNSLVAVYKGKYILDISSTLHLLALFSIHSCLTSPCLIQATPTIPRSSTPSAFSNVRSTINSNYAEHCLAINRSPFLAILFSVSCLSRRVSVVMRHVVSIKICRPSFRYGSNLVFIQAA